MEKISTRSNRNAIPLQYPLTHKIPISYNPVFFPAALPQRMQKQHTVPGCKDILCIGSSLPVRAGRSRPFLAQFGGGAAVIFLAELI